MKRILITLILLIAFIYSYSQRQIVTNKITINGGSVTNIVDTAYMVNDTLFIEYAHGDIGTIPGFSNVWATSGNDISNSNTGKVTINGDSLYLSPLPDQETVRVGRILSVETDGTVEWVSPSVLGDDIDSARGASPTAYTTWVRDSTNGYVYIAHTNDNVGIGTISPQVALDVRDAFYLQGRGPDIDGNGQVQPSDMYEILDAIGSFDIETFAKADADGNNKLDVGDYSLWLASNGYAANDPIVDSNKMYAKSGIYNGWISTSTNFGHGHYGDSIFNMGKYMTYGFDALSTPQIYVDTIPEYIAVFDHLTIENTFRGLPFISQSGNVLKLVKKSDFVSGLGLNSLAWSRTSASNSVYLTQESDSVGIGTSTPSEKLDVNGNINIPTTTSGVGQIKQNGTTIFHTYQDGDGANLFIGEDVGNFTTSGNYNFAMGNDVMTSNTTGGNNIAIGATALNANTTGGLNTVAGYAAGLGNTTGNYNTFIGANAGYTNSTGSSNVFLGYNAGYSETGSNKLYIENSNSATPLIWGDFANDTVRVNGVLDVTGNARLDGSIISNGGAFTLSSTGKLFLDRGSNNITIGAEINNSLNTGSENIFLGTRAGYVAANNSYNIYIGYRSGYSSTSGDYNTCIGPYTMYYFNNAQSNIAIGESALFGSSGASTGDYLTAIGRYAGFKHTTGNNSVYLGYAAGYSQTDGASGIYIGHRAGYDVTTGTHLYIANNEDNGAYNSTWIYGNSTYDVSIPNGDLTVAGDIDANGTIINDKGTIANNDDTPDISGANVWEYDGTANSVSIVSLDNHQVGAFYTIIGNSDTYTITIIDGTPAGGDSFNLSGSNWVGGNDDVLMLYCISSDNFIEVSRSNN